MEMLKNMIRKQVIFKPTKIIKLPYNYQYDVMKNIYYYISIADDVISKRLHNKGYISDTGHVYKLFNYTLLFENVKFVKDNIICDKNSTIKLVLSGKKELIQKTLKGLLHIKKIKIGDNEIPLQNIIDDKKVFFKPIMLYNALSPVIESTLDDDKNVVYQTPYESDYYKNLAENAKRKYKLIHGKEFKGKLFFDIDNALEIKDKFIQIKEGGVKGYQYSIWIETDKEMQKIIYYLGLGQNSSTGCGCLNFVTGVNADE